MAGPDLKGAGSPPQKKNSLGKLYYFTNLNQVRRFWDDSPQSNYDFINYPDQQFLIYIH